MRGTDPLPEQPAYVNHTSFSTETLETYRRVSHEIEWYARILLCQVLAKELDILHLPCPVRLAVRRILALVRRIECRTSVSSQVEREDRYTVCRVLDVRMLVPTDVFCETMHEQHDGFRERRGVRPGVELVAVEPRQPCLSVIARRHHSSVFKLRIACHHEQNQAECVVQGVGTCQTPGHSGSRI